MLVWKNGGGGEISYQILHQNSLDNTRLFLWGFFLNFFSLAFKEAFSHYSLSLSLSLSLSFSLCWHEMFSINADAVAYLKLNICENLSARGPLVLITVRHMSIQFLVLGWRLTTAGSASFAFRTFFLHLFHCY